MSNTDLMFIFYFVSFLCCTPEACPLGAYCPLATLNKDTGICEPWVHGFTLSIYWRSSNLCGRSKRLWFLYCSCSVGIHTSYHPASPTILVVEQIFGATLVYLVRCSARQGHTVLQQQRKVLAVVGIYFLPERLIQQLHDVFTSSLFSV